MGDVCCSGMEEDSTPSEEWWIYFGLKLGISAIQFITPSGSITLEFEAHRGMLVRATLTMSAVLTVSLHLEPAGTRRVSFCMLWRNAGNSCGGELSSWNGDYGW